MNQIAKTYEEIKSLKIQGATNVAIAVISAIRNFAKTEKNRVSISKIREIGTFLSEARINEPLARNAVNFICSGYKNEEVHYDEILNKADHFERMIDEAKKKMIKFGVNELKENETILTHCHSSTSTAILKGVDIERRKQKKHFRVVSSETRPIFQGRITAKELVSSNIETFQITDSALTSFIIYNDEFKIDAAIVGCDELYKDGSFVNKVGTLSIAVAANFVGDKLYVATTLLKLNLLKNFKSIEIEKRSEDEVWKDAPAGLKIKNPAFDKVKSDLVYAYITEEGVFKGKTKVLELLKKAQSKYPWLFE